LLSDYFDGSRTILLATHQVDEIQNVLTDVVFLDRGRIVFQCSMDEVESRFAEVTVNPENVTAAKALKPMNERQVFGRSVLLFDGADRQQLSALGEVRTPRVEDLFVAVVGSRASQAQGVAV
jgi:ABC-2 type transport system ATP-binding protein